MEAVSSRTDLSLREIAGAWRAATASTSFIPLPAAAVGERFEQLTAAALAALQATGPAGEIVHRGRAIGNELVSLNLLKPEALESTLTCLSEQLSGVAAADRLSYLLAGIASGFAGATEAALLAQQEAVSRAATSALRQAQTDLAASRDSLSAVNRELSEQVLERTRAEEMQRDLAERLQRLHQIELAILSAGSLATILDLAIEHLDSLIPAISIAITHLDVAQQKSIILRSTNPAYPPGRELPITMVAALNQLGEGESIYLPDLQAIRDTSPGVTEIAALGGRSVLAVPLRYRDHLLGGLMIVLGEARPFTPAETAVVQELAGSLTVAIQNRRLLEAEQTTRQRETVLREVAAALTMNMALDQLLNHILSQLDRVITSQSSAIVLLEDDGPRIVAQRGIPSSAEQLNNLLKNQPLSLWTVLETAQPSIINDTHASPDWTIVEGLEYVRSWLAVPLLVKGELTGLLTMDRDQPHAFADGDMEMALTFANQAAIAIDNARLFARQQAHAGELERHVRQRTRDLEMLYSLTAAAVENPDMDGLLRQCVMLAEEAFGCTAAAVFLAEGDEGDFRLAALSAGNEPRWGELLTSLDAENPILYPPLPTPRFLTGLELPPSWGIDDDWNLITAPLRARRRVIGVLTLLCMRHNAPSEIDPELLTAIADQIGAAVENIRLHQIARQSAIIEERDRLAREIHDQVTQSIYSAGLFAEAARSAAEVRDLDKAQHHIRSTLRMTNQALRELRLLLFEFRTDALARHGLVDALRERLKTVEHRAGISADVYAPNLSELPVAIEETYYRIALEALNNALRHSRANQVDIILMIEEGDIIMTIVDNGIGFDREVAAGSGGLGLEGMQKRIGKVGGVLTLSSSEDGTWITARAPLA